MSLLNQIKALYAYNDWANGHVIDAASALTDAEYGRDLGASFGSVRGNLAHIVGAQMLWLGRFNSARGGNLPEVEGSLDAVRRLNTSFHAGLRDFLAFLPESDLPKAISYVDTRETPREHQLGQLLVHVVNHGTHHRAEAAMLLTSLGYAPRQLDYVFFELERSGAEPRLT